MKLKFMLILFAVALFASCSKDTENEMIEDSNNLSPQSLLENYGQTAGKSFDAEAAYYRLLQSNNMINDLKNRYSASQQSEIWKFKYDRYLNENQINLTTNQIHMVNNLKIFVDNVNLFERTENFINEINTIVADTENAFPENDARTATLLTGSLENNEFDVPVNPSTGEPKALACFWCTEFTGGSSPCVLDLETGEFQTTFEVQDYVFFFPSGDPYDANYGCTYGEWEDDGYLTD